MTIKTVSIIGLGALGILFAKHFSERLPKDDVRVIVNPSRKQRYEQNGIYCNGERFDFNYVLPESEQKPVDLLFFCVKFNQLQQAIEDARHQVGDHTIILSALNGISSEEIIGKTFGMEKMLYCVAQGMDAVKIENKLTYKNMGMICFGEKENTVWSEKVTSVADFLNNLDFPYEVPKDMDHRLWGKFMLNTGVNQTVAVFSTNYGGIQIEGESRNVMIAAMREVIALSQKVGINLGESDLAYWLNVLAKLNPLGMPSMRQDMAANRNTEVGLFSGTVIALGKQYHVPTPINEWLYQKVQELEKDF
ncbi:ketopantoate reductase family protein [Desulfosporosinus sp. BICA1-9]|uniref:ketopantoate reductase family protein n=1 Tax=Desulfosporosinus sp. BICA1-9 TaxID=1531958 RepID=UPI00054B9D80|nr:ketopantoate reductase family protein [Desulfosporosinus sp. BICA1-9]KJS47655.1 MAG: 2-dehydropantoate 2-reductase [Peptococcaceae bacterium BRH_c23]KJS82773.1 MAG: 2-dehydropantoate 2-reductase [Desulfosporosinus sp. BICA1-9]HBW36779.1 ketopantoate reductase family protein [Desulfosporosinus sp.]